MTPLRLTEDASANLSADINIIYYRRIYEMEKLIAKDLLSIGAVFLRPEQPFTWASGIKKIGRAHV